MEMCSFLVKKFFFLVHRNQCFTPSFPKNGSYLANGITTPEGKAVVPFTVLTYNCDPGFAPNLESPISVCYEKKWVPEIECKREYYLTF